MSKTPRKIARAQSAPSAPPVTAGLITASLLGTNHRSFAALFPAAEQELAEVFPLEGFEVEFITQAAERLHDTAFHDNVDAHGRPFDDHYALAGFVLGLLTGLRLAGAR